MPVGPASVHWKAKHFLKRNAVHSPTHRKAFLLWKICSVWIYMGYMKISSPSSSITWGSRDFQRWSNIAVYSWVIAVHKLWNFLWKLLSHDCDFFSCLLISSVFLTIQQTFWVCLETASFRSFNSFLNNCFILWKDLL